MRIGVLERPSARPHVGPPRHPVALDLEDLLRHQPIETLAGLRDRALAADLEQRVTGEPGVPHRRDAGLAVGLVLVHHQELLDRFAGDRAQRMVFRIAEHVEHHHAVGHGREDRAEPVLAVEPLRHPGHRAIDRALPRSLRKQRLGGAQHDVDAAEEPEPRRPSAAAPSAPARASSGGARNSSSMVTPLGLRALAFFACSTKSGTMTVRLQYEILSRWNGNQRGSSMISTGITGTARHGMNAEQREHQPREHVGARRAAARQDRLARTRHVRGVDRIADHLEREIGLHARAHVEGAVVEQRPAAVLALDAAQIDRDLGFELGARPARRDSGAAARIRPGWWRRPRARTPNARPAAAWRAAPGSPASMFRSGSGAAAVGAECMSGRDDTLLISPCSDTSRPHEIGGPVAGADRALRWSPAISCRSNRRRATDCATRWRRRAAWHSAPASPRRWRGARARSATAAAPWEGR